ncbi:methionyl-tRNA formyltransferase [Ferrigenium sp. UT5]|uniref:methionyl-tRNA formyltransferase n=1 Tax=Ferrigenium sp. UT5 TaxID=3242105 RepID=UPI003551A2B5
MKIVFAGTPQFAASALNALLEKPYQILAVLTQPDRPSGRGMQLAASPVKQLALNHGLSVLQPDSLKAESIQQTLRELQADVMVVAAYGLILPQSVLQIPRFGCLNIHASLLPRWRGAAPIQRAILAGDNETGITIMQMDAGLDTGDMLLQKTCPIAGSDTAQTLHDKLATLGAESLIETLHLLAAGALHPQKQDESRTCYAAKLNKQEARMDWSRSAVELERAVRAYNPFPTAFTEANETLLKIWKAGVGTASGLPGTVLEINGTGIKVACGAGSLVLEVLQKPGGKALPAAQFIQGFSLKVGDRLGMSPA